MNYMILIDGTSAAIVVGGALAATVLRCGVRGCYLALRSLFGSLKPRFNADKARAELAVQIQGIKRDGFLRAEPHHFGDREFDEVTDTLIERRSTGALLDKHQSFKDRRVERSATAVATINQAAEMAPVFGLVGTLVALSQMAVDAGPETLLSSSIPMAIVTTFYGLIAAHLVFAPLALFVERRAAKEEAERQKLVDWLADELAEECAPRERSPVHIPAQVAA